MPVAGDNNSMIDNGHPIKLLNLFMKYPEKGLSVSRRISLESDYAAIGKNFTNVYLDIVWLPQISKQRR
jgi:hypothetical protein